VKLYTYDEAIGYFLEKMYQKRRMNINFRPVLGLKGETKNGISS
jgi:hypothetical protein